MAASGVRSSWLTSPRNSARSRSSSSSGARSCMVTTTAATAPSSPWIGVALTSIDTLRPSGAESTISSARTVPAFASSAASAASSRAISRPSPNRQVTVAGNPAPSPSAARNGATSRSASRFDDSGRPVRASRTITPTGVVSISASRSARARRSCSWARALTIAAAACEANSSSISSSAALNSGASSLPARKKLPTCTPRWRMAVP